MSKTVIGLFDSTNEAQQVVQGLLDAGFNRTEISLIAQNKSAEGGEFASKEAAADAGDAAGAGALGGTVLGGTLGLLVGTGLLLIPGIGPVLAAGPLAAAIGTTGAALGATALGAGIGAATGGLVGGLVGAGVPDEDANYYAEGVRRGGTLVSVATDDMQVDRAYAVMQQYGAVNIKERGAQWQASGMDGAANNTDHGTNDWERSSKVGTGTGTVSGAATGAAIGSAGGPVGTVIGGVAGAVVGGATGAAGDAAGERLEDETDDEYTERMRRQSRLNSAR